jgi:YHS domain-containing protein
MNSNVIIAALCAVCLACGCNTENQAKETPVPPAAKTLPAPEAPAALEAPESPEAPAPSIDISTLAMKLDPVCKMSLEEYPATCTAEHGGKSYGFCSDFCKRKFVESPDAILARFADAAPATEAKP